MMLAILCNVTLGALNMFVGNAAVLLLFIYIMHLYIYYLLFLLYAYIYKINKISRHGIQS